MTLTQDRPAASLSEVARRAMIDNQLRPEGVNEPWVLSAMMALAREDFVPAGLRDAAYMDRAVPLGEGRFLAAPPVHARMLAEAVPTAEDKALLVGDGAGYLAALLRPLVGSLEAIAPADALAKRRGRDGYSLIVVDGAAEVLPDALVSALAEGGRLVTGIVERGVTRLAAGRKTGGTFALLPLADIGIPVLPEFAAPRRWSF